MNQQAKDIAMMTDLVFPNSRAEKLERDIAAWKRDWESIRERIGSEDAYELANWPLDNLRHRVAVSNPQVVKEAAE